MPAIQYHKPLNILVAVKGHPFDRTAFDSFFAACDDVAFSVVDQPAAGRLMTPQGMAGFDALVLYDMPGIDFATAEATRPGLVEPGPALREGLEACLRQGVGVVALHHAIAGWPAWPQYAEILGGVFLYKRGVVRGQPTLDSGYRLDVSYTARNVAPSHPVMKGVPASFPVNDELYLSEVFEEDVIPLLRADYPFDREHFFSAEAAVNGRRDSNEGWDHAPTSNLIAWAKRAHSSPLVYIQPGDGAHAYRDANLQAMLRNAIHWVASPEAKAWARDAEPVTAA